MPSIPQCFKKLKKCFCTHVQDIVTGENTIYRIVWWGKVTDIFELASIYCGGIHKKLFTVVSYEKKVGAGGKPGWWADIKGKFFITLYSSYIFFI